MRRPLVIFLTGFVLTASSFAPVCELGCSLAQERTAQAVAATNPASGHCQEGPSENGSRGEPSKEHPCKRDNHHRFEQSVPPVRSTLMQTARPTGDFLPVSALLVLQPGHPTVHEPPWRELASPPDSRVSPLFLRI